MQRMTFAILISLLTAPVAALGGPVVGEPAPPVELEILLQAEEGAEATLAALKGNVVVLEFWATWCAPCVAAIPHMNELVEEFKGRPVRFISITDEDAETVGAFLGRKAMRAWIGLDSDHSVFDGYEVRGIPATAIIGADGALLAVTYPTRVKPEHIEAALRGEDLDFPQSATRVYTTGEDPDDPDDLPEYSLRITIRPSTNTEMAPDSRFSGEGTGPGAFTTIDASLHHLIGRAIDLPTGQVIGHEGMLGQRATVAVKTPPDLGAEIGPLLLSALQTAYAFTTREEMRPVEVIVLAPLVKRPDGLEPSVMERGRSIRTGPSYIEAMNSSLEHLTETLDQTFFPDTPVINETGLDGGFDFSIKWDPDQPQEVAILTALREQLGLTVRKESRPARYVIVELK